MHRAVVKHSQEEVAVKLIDLELLGDHLVWRLCAVKFYYFQQILIGTCVGH